MIAKNFADVGAADIETLVTNATPESTTLEFKRDLPGRDDDSKRELLADVSALANTLGGDLLYGIDERDGSANTIVGIGTEDTDGELLRLGNILNSGLEPRVRYSAKMIACLAGKVLLLRIDKSWNAPHRVVFRGHDRFYGRTATGKYALDVQQLRRAFTENNSVTERLRNFRAERLASIIANATPVTMDGGPKFVLHLLPLEAFYSQTTYDVGRNLPFNDFSPLSGAGWGARLTLEGNLVSAVRGSRSAPESYLHLYRNGVIEMVDGRLLSETPPAEGRQRYIPSLSFENYVFKGVNKGISLLRAIGASGPVAVALTLTDTKGMLLGIELWRFDIDQHPILNDHLFLPEVLLEDLTTDFTPVIKPVLDMVWNACGVSSSPYFDEKGKWQPR